MQNKQIPGYLNGYLEGFRVGIGKHGEIQDYLLDDKTILAELKRNEIYVIRADGIEIDEHGILFTGKSNVGKTSICNDLTKKLNGRYFIGDEDSELEFGLMVLEPEARVFPIVQTTANKASYQEGFPITDIVHVVRGSFPRLDRLDKSCDLKQLYGFLSGNLIWDEKDRIKDVKYVNAMMNAAKSRAAQPNHYRLVNPEDKLEETIKLLVNRFKP